MTAQNVAEKLAERLREIVWEVGYAPETVTVLPPRRGYRWGERWAVAVDIGSFMFLPFKDSINYLWDIGGWQSDKTWRTPDGFFIENQTDHIAVIYEED